MRILGVDLGERRIGLALAEARGAARPFATLRRSTLEHDLATLARLVTEQGIGELVIGLPRNMDGSEGPQAERTRAWAEAVGAALGLPVVLRDERLTSEAAQDALGPMRRSRTGRPPTRAGRERYRAAVDREAARRILQAELDARAERGSGTAP